MLKHKDHFHGSDLEKIEEIYGIKKEDITSFSANVNPLGISPKMREALIRHIDIITSYPDREYTALRTRIGEYAGASAQNILVGNGSTELISLFIQMEHPKTSGRFPWAAAPPSITRCGRKMSLSWMWRISKGT